MDRDPDIQSLLPIVVGAHPRAEERIGRVVEGTKVERLHQLDPVNVERFIAGLRHKKRPTLAQVRRKRFGRFVVNSVCVLRCVGGSAVS